MEGSGSRTHLRPDQLTFHTHLASGFGVPIPVISLEGGAARPCPHPPQSQLFDVIGGVSHGGRRSAAVINTSSAGLACW